MVNDNAPVTIKDLNATKEELKKDIETTNKNVEKIVQRLDKQEKSLDLVAGQVAKNTSAIEKNTTAIEDLRIMNTLVIERMEKLETKEDADRKFNLLMNAIDGVVGRIDVYRIEQVATDGTVQRLDAKVVNHEDRIRMLEAIAA